MEMIEKQDFITAFAEARLTIRKHGMSMIKKSKKKGKVAELPGVNKNIVTSQSQKMACRKVSCHRKTCQIGEHRYIGWAQRETT